MRFRCYALKRKIHFPLNFTQARFGAERSFEGVLYILNRLIAVSNGPRA